MLGVRRLPDPTGHARRLAHGRDRGASFTEYAAVTLCVAVIAGAVLIAVPGGVGDVFRDALCRLGALVSDGECDTSAPQADDEPTYDYTPTYCVRDGSKKTYGYSLDIGFLTFGQEYSYAKEVLSNGKMIVTFVPSAEVGVAGGVGWDFGKENAAHTEAGLDGSASAHLASGMTYIFDSEEEFEKFEEEVNAAIAEEQSRMMNPEGEAGKAIAEWLGFYERPKITVEPAVRTGTIEIEANGDASVGAWISRADSGGDAWDMNLGAQGSVTISGKYDHSTWYSDPKNIQTSETYGWTATGNIGATALAAHADGELSWSGGTRVMRNEDGSLASIRYMTNAEGSFNIGVDKKTGTGSNNGGIDAGKKQTKSVTQMVELDFDTPEEQAAGEALLKERGLLPPTYVANAMADQLGEEDYGGDIATQPDGDAPDWEHLFYKKGRAWQNASDVETDQMEFSAKVKLGLQFGASTSWAMEERHTTDALMLDGPDNGARRFIDYADCVSDKAERKNDG
ncbi:hypothetical protein GCM10009799_30970 [Nocardiopsis rhodophaea]|uniref:Uncharacterized protein n=1 Tax=Nocardiopsis rhodophaea TaxID=280238 RepID=A0ABP5EPU1_9ACTN